MNSLIKALFMLFCMVNYCYATTDYFQNINVSTPNPTISYQASPAGAVARTYQSKFGEHVSLQDFGGKGDAISGADGAITSGAATFTSSSASFVSTDVGKAIEVNGAGSSGAPLLTTISAFNSATSVTLAVNASTTVSEATYTYGTDNTSAINSWLSAIQNGTGYIPYGKYMFTSALTLPNSFTSITGAGKYNSIFVYAGTNTTNNLISLIGTSSTAIANSMNLSGFGIRSNTVMTGGDALFIKWSAQIRIKDIALGASHDPNHNLYHGIEYYSTDFQTLEDFEIQVQGEGIRASGCGVACSYPQFDLWVTRGKVSGGTTGIHIGGGFDNAYFDKMMVTFNNQNVVIDNAIQNYKNQEIGFGSQFITDQPQTGDNYYINDTLANIAQYCQISIYGAVTGSKAGNGIHVHSWPSCYINVLSPHIANNNQNGILIDDASSKVLISSSTDIVNNGQWGINSAFANTAVNGQPIVASNTVGQVNANTIMNHYANSYVTNTPATSQPALDTSGSSATISIANGGNATLPIGSGLVIATNNNGGNNVGVYSIGSGVVAQITPANIWVAPTTSPASGKISIQWNGSNYAIYNNTGSTVTAGVAFIRTSNSN
ncbi:hypothetical protein E0H77_12485 [Acinetobacter sp. ANC 4633]|uniref:hypothetical protein n=1 Tax=Acinetobacter sp. ANC 4633 TaxID=2529845 RepID=UPI00103F752C|nr:hypothetical protein [Acinetobacter sp. ANC 4633]TCB23933.1 hypothetical protein E0H77_12485 [Acinetobacter sp. ANC 4633]